MTKLCVARALLGGRAGASGSKVLRVCTHQQSRRFGGCCHVPAPSASLQHGDDCSEGAKEQAFQIDQLPTVKWGPALIRDELGPDAARLAGETPRVAVITDKVVADLEIFEVTASCCRLLMTARPSVPTKCCPCIQDAISSLRRAGLDFGVYDEVMVEPTDASFEDAARFAADGKFTAYVSVGGGSVIDTCKVANLLATHPAPLMDYVNAPLGKAVPVPSPLQPHIACPTTTGEIGSLNPHFMLNPDPNPKGPAPSAPVTPSVT